jgi:hypothetical protein
MIVGALAFQENPLTISIIIAIASMCVACLITAFEPQLTAWTARLALRRTESIQPETRHRAREASLAAPKPVSRRRRRPPIVVTLLRRPQRRTAL